MGKVKTIYVLKDYNLVSTLVGLLISKVWRVTVTSVLVFFRSNSL